MIGQLIGSLTGLATSIIDGKTQIKLTEAEIKKKQLTGEIDWDLEAMRATENSWKDEWITLLFSIPLILAFCGEWGNAIVAQGLCVTRDNASVVSDCIRWHCKCQHRNAFSE